MLLLVPLRRWPVASFVVLAFLLSWRRWIESLISGGPFDGVGSLGPFVAALLVLLANEGGAGAKGLLRRLVQWRAPWRWVLFAVGLPVAISTAAAITAVALGAPMPSTARLAAWPQALAAFPIIFLVGGPLGEEPGWRGFLQPRLGARLAPGAAGLATGAIWALWHLPLQLSAAPIFQIAFFVEVCAVAVLMERLLAETGGSVLYAMIFHAVENTFGGGYVGALFDDRLPLTLARTAIFAAVAAAVALARSEQRPVAALPAR